MLPKLIVPSQLKTYSVLFDQTFDDLKKNSSDYSAVIVDKNILRLYPELLSNNNIIPVECTESNKTLSGCSLILNELIKRNIKADGNIMAVGGGILQDIVGFCSSVFCRGVDYTLVPTTLLSQVDSCIGGKTSINFNQAKNILGTFYPPKDIIIIPEFIVTLSSLDYLSGFGEVYKFLILQNKIHRFNINDNIKNIIYDSLVFKCSILEKDEFDRKDRKFLNFGHTIGHAIESSSNYSIPHGIAVILGCMIECGISVQMGYRPQDINKIIDIGNELLSMSKLDIDPTWLDFNNLLEYMMSDKKSTKQLINMVLMDETPFIFSFSDQTLLQKCYQKTLSDYQIIQ